MSSLEEIIKEEIRASGPVTFARFMELALYHPEHGYYASGRARIGRSGDFYTSPHAGSLFGRLVAELYLKLTDCLPGPCSFVEMGAGEGFMAKDFLEGMKALHPEEFERLSYIVVERSEGMRARQEETLQGFRGRVTWYGSLSEMPAPVDGVFFSNELVDAMPFHRVVQCRAEMLEIYITLRDGLLFEEAGPLSTLELNGYFDRLGIWLPEGITTEVNLSALGWMRELSGRLGHGFVVTVDYGYPAAEYYSAMRGRGTLMCYRSHNANEEPLADIGEQDITAHVDFTSLALEGKEAGLAPVYFADQTAFLTGPAGWLNDALIKSGASQEELERTGRGLIAIMHPEWMGGAFRALVQSKGVEGCRAFRGARNQLDTLSAR
jgi:SAM-dependent MidA family methyltransferase